MGWEGLLGRICVKCWMAAAALVETPHGRVGAADFWHTGGVVSKLEGNATAVSADSGEGDSSILIISIHVGLVIGRSRAFLQSNAGLASPNPLSTKVDWLPMRNNSIFCWFLVLMLLLLFVSAQLVTLRMVSFF